MSSRSLYMRSGVGWAVALLCCGWGAVAWAAAPSLPPSIAERARRATVLVLTKKKDVLARSYGLSGTGFFVGQQGLLLTSERVVRDADSVRVVLDSGLPTQRILSAEVAKRSAKEGLALLRAEGSAPAWLEPAADAAPTVGHGVWALGYPLQLSAPGKGVGPVPSVRAGKVASVAGGDGAGPGLLRTSAAIAPGGDGGPLVDASGLVVGMAVLRIEGGSMSREASGIAAGTLRRFLQGAPTASEGGDVSRPAYVERTGRAAPGWADLLKPSRGSFRQGVLAHLYARRYDTAAQLARARAAATQVSRLVAEADRLSEAAEACKGFWEGVLKDAAGAKGRVLRLKHGVWQVVGAERGGLVLRSGGAEITVDPLELPVREAAKIVGRSTLGQRSHFVLACAYAFDAEWTRAQVESSRVRRATDPRLSALVGRWREEYAEMLLRGLKAAATADDDPEILAALTALRDSYQDLDVVRSERSWIDASIRAKRGEAAEPLRVPRSFASRECPRCKGSGVINVKRKRYRNVGVGYWEHYTVKKRCPDCRGTGRR